MAHSRAQHPGLASLASSGSRCSLSGWRSGSCSPLSAQGTAGPGQPLAPTLGCRVRLGNLEGQVSTPLLLTEASAFPQWPLPGGGRGWGDAVLSFAEMRRPASLVPLTACRSVSLCQLEEMHNLGVVSFIWGKMRTEPGRQNLRCAERLLWRGRGRPADTIVVKGVLSAIKLSIHKRIYASHVALMSP